MVPAPVQPRRVRARPSMCSGLGRRELVLALAGLAAAPRLARAVPAASVGGDLIGALRFHLTEAEDTLLDIARTYDVGILELSAANPGIDPWIPGADQLVLLPTAHLLPDAPREGIVINKAELRLYWLPREGPIETHAIGVGREGFDTPVGQTRVVRKQKDPTWYPTAATRADRPELPAVVPPGPDNPLGHRALYLGWPTYLIHGTNKPYGVGRRVSRGCIRMYPEAIERLFDQVQVGTLVTVVDQQVKLGRHAGELWLEAHPDLGQLEELEETYAFTPRPGEVDPVVLDRLRGLAGPDLERIDWDRVRAELVARRGIPVQVTRPTATPAPEPPARGGDLPGGLY